jgi:hypothetical protein
MFSILEGDETIMEISEWKARLKMETEQDNP